MKCLAIMFFKIPSSKDIIATLRIVRLDKPKLTFLLIFYFHATAMLIDGVGFAVQPVVVLAFLNLCDYL